MGVQIRHAAVEVATAYLAAMAAKRLGVQVYVAQYMFNTPPGISPEDGFGEGAGEEGTYRVS